MKNRILLVFTIILFFLLIFIIQKIIFLFIYTNILQDFSFGILLSIIRLGFIYDLTMASYFSAFPILLILFSVWINRSVITLLSNLYFFIAIVVVTLIAVCDIFFYPIFGLRLSYDSFINLTVFNDRFLTSFVVQLIVGVFISISIIFVLYIGYNYLIKRQISKLRVPKSLTKTFFVILFLGILCAIPVKLVKSPIYATMSDLFNGNTALNQAVINEQFYFITSYFNTKSEIKD